jgi:phage tail-like protein
MPGETKGDAFPGNMFVLKLGGKESVGQFREVSGLDSETEVVDQKTTDARGLVVIKKVPGAQKWSNISLKRGIDQTMDMWKWREVVVQKGAKDARVDGEISLVDWTGAEVAKWSFLQGWPVSYKGATLNSGGNEAAVEEIDIAHEGLTRTM